MAFGRRSPPCPLPGERGPGNRRLSRSFRRPLLPAGRVALRAGRSTAAERLLQCRGRAGVPLVAAGDVHYHVAERQALGDVLAAMRHGCTVATAGERLFPNAQRHLQSLEEMAALFPAHPMPCAARWKSPSAARFRSTSCVTNIPRSWPRRARRPCEYLARLAWAGPRERYPRGVPDKVRRLMEHELKLIEELHYEAYFLTVWDLVRFARRRGILCQGRGSAANSAVCYCLGITVGRSRADGLALRAIHQPRAERGPRHRR